MCLILCSFNLFNLKTQWAWPSSVIQSMTRPYDYNKSPLGVVVSDITERKNLNHICHDDLCWAGVVSYCWMESDSKYPLNLHVTSMNNMALCQWRVKCRLALNDRHILKCKFYRGDFCSFVNKTVLNGFWTFYKFNARLKVGKWDVFKIHYLNTTRSF